MNQNVQKRLERIEATLTRALPVENSVAVRVIYDASDLNQATIKARPSPGHDVIFLPKHGKAACSTCSGVRAKWRAAATFAFEGTAATQAQLDQLEAFADSGGASESTNRAIRSLSKMDYFSGAHALKEDESLWVNCGVAVFRFPDKKPLPE